MVNCCVIGCFNNSNKMRTTVGFHRFPTKKKSPELFKKWLDKVNRANFKPTMYTRVCSVHFAKEDYEPSVALKKELLPNQRVQPILKKTAVPTLHLKGQPFAKKRRQKVARVADEIVIKSEPHSGNEADLTIVKSEICDDFDAEKAIKTERDAAAFFHTPLATFGGNILELFKRCQICGSAIKAVSHAFEGPRTIIKSTCVEEHNFEWQSQYLPSNTKSAN